MPTTYYIRKIGNNANAGTSPGAAWLTIGKALGATGIASGDTVYIGAGTYREVVTVAMTSATVETKIIGDVDGAQTGDAGQVVWTAWTTSYTAAPSASSLLSLNGRDFLTFQNLFMHGGSAVSGIVDATTAHSTNITFTACVFYHGKGNNQLLSYNGIADVASHYLFDRCGFWSNNIGFVMTLNTSASADYDVDWLFRNSWFICSNGPAILVLGSGADAFKPGGVRVNQCTFMSAQTALQINPANIASVAPNQSSVYNSVIFSAGTALSANTLGQLLEDSNLFCAVTPRTNVTAGGNSKTQTDTAAILSMHSSVVVGSLLRPFFQPLPDSPILGGITGTGTPQTIDFLNRPRPAGGASIVQAVGAFERHDFGAQEGSVIDASTSSLRLTGPGDQDQVVPVDAVATTLTVRGRYDTNHAATNKPQVILIANGEIAVTTQTVTMTVGVDTWETLTIGPFTPTAKGFVTLRLVSRAAAGNGIAYFDTIHSTSSIGSGNEDYWRRGEAFPAATTGGGKFWRFP